jgi:hypothetical protein
LALPCELPAFKEQIADVITGLAGVCADLREISREFTQRLCRREGWVWP